LHGQPGSGTDFEGVRAWLDPRWRLVAPDRPGWGDNPREATTITSNAEWAISCISERQVVVVGHSFGAAIAVRVAELAPSRVAGVVLVAPAVSVSAILAIDRVLGARVLGQVGAMLIVGTQVKGNTVDGLARGRRSFFVEQRHLLREVALVEHSLGVIDANVVVVAGVRDRVVPASAVLDTLAYLPGAKIDVVLNGGHDLVRSHPWRVAAAISRVLDNF